MKEIGYCILIIVIASASYGIFLYYRYNPHRNPHPKYFVTIKGTVSPALQSKIRFYMSYATRAKRCDYQGFDVDYSRGHADDFKPIFNKQNEYSLVIPLDKYKPGWCQWNVSDFGFYFVNEKHAAYQDVIDFDDDSDPNFPDASKYFSKKNRLDFGCSMQKAMYGVHYIKLTRCKSKHHFKDSGLLLKTTTGHDSIILNFSGETYANSN